MLGAFPKDGADGRQGGPRPPRELEAYGQTTPWAAPKLASKAEVDQRLLDLVPELGLPKSGQEVVEAIILGEPVRRVRGAGSNVTFRYVSWKMGGETREAESRGLEKVALYSYEYDPFVWGYYDQAWEVPVTYRMPSGHVVRRLHVPDFFLIKTPPSGVLTAGFEEWKRTDALERLSCEKLGLYVKVGSAWLNPTAERWCADRGLSYVVRTELDCPVVRSGNLAFLEQYLRRSDAA